MKLEIRNLKFGIRDPNPLTRIPKRVTRIWIFLILGCLSMARLNSFSQEYTMPSFIDAMTSYDFDCDGFNDIIVSCPYSDTIVIMFNDGVGNFTLNYYNRSSDNSILCGLMDNDTLPDLITLNAEGISFIKNLGQRTLGDNHSIYNISGSVYLTVIKDMNQDNFNDLIYTNTYPQCWGVLKNNGDLSFTSKVYISGSSTTMPYAGFLDADSLPDIVLSYNVFNRSSVYLNNGNFNFTEVVLEDHFNANTPIMNLDNSIPVDIGLVSYDVSDIKLFKYIGNEQFELQSDFYATGTYDIADFLVADFNLDGYDDFAIPRCSWTDCTDSIYIYLNNHKWSFDKPQQYFVGTLYFFRFYSSDLNGDSFPDIYMKGYSENSTIKILWNDGFGFFSYENPVKIKENEINPIKLDIFPNPALNIITISYSGNLNNKNCDVIIFNNLGVKVSLVPVLHNEKELNADISSLPAGFYLVEVRFKGGLVGTGKFFIVR
jgi:hypothetical protein